MLAWEGLMRDERAPVVVGDKRTGRHRERGVRDYPVREYVGAMAVELAQMARWDGDEQLALLLDAAAEAASRNPAD